MIYFTKHASEKFDILGKHKITISEEFVIQTIENPEVIDYSRLPLKIAQRAFDKYRVLRVVYKEHDNIKTVVTFYPGKKNQYEKK
jgi:hypothetical protein